MCDFIIRLLCLCYYEIDKLAPISELTIEACKASELEQREKERKALAAFQKRIAEQKAKAAEMKKFLGKTDIVEDEIDDE